MMDEKESRNRFKSFEAEVDMKVMHKVQQRKMIDYQKSMATNVPPKTDRLYQRILEKEQAEISKEEQNFYLGHFKANYGIKTHYLFQNMVNNKDREISIN